MGPFGGPIMIFKKIRCKYCRCLFPPDSRTHNPIACQKPECQRQRKYDSDKKWRYNDPDVMEDRRQSTREWIAAHPNYLQKYRASHPQYVDKNRAKQKQRRSKCPVDISAPISPYPIEKQNDSLKLPPTLIYQPRYYPNSLIHIINPLDYPPVDISTLIDSSILFRYFENHEHLKKNRIPYRQPYSQNPRLF
jgi:hypothetical protein